MFLIQKRWNLHFLNKRVPFPHHVRGIVPRFQLRYIFLALHCQIIELINEKKTTYRLPMERYTYLGELPTMRHSMTFMFWMLVSTSHITHHINVIGSERLRAHKFSLFNKQIEFYSIDLFCFREIDVEEVFYVGYSFVSDIFSSLCQNLQQNPFVGRRPRK
jgi:hypothetical protein